MKGKKVNVFSSKEEHKQACVSYAKETLKEHGHNLLDTLLDFVYEKGYLKGEVDERQREEELRNKYNK